MRHLFGTGLLAALLAATGCGDKGDTDGLVPVAGTILVDDQPAANAAVAFFPTGDTKGNGGIGATDANGRYEITTPQGKKGLVPGKYKVTVSRRLNADGSLPDPNIPPIESRAIETLPTKYHDKEKTELNVTIAADDKKAFDFDLKVKKK